MSCLLFMEELRIGSMAHSVRGGVWGSVIELWVGWWGLGVGRMCEIVLFVCQEVVHEVPVVQMLVGRCSKLR